MVDKEYLKLCQYILDNGIEKEDRTGVGTKSIFGYQMKFDLSEGFPLLTTKKVNFNLVWSELLWFIKGDTNIKFLLENVAAVIGDEKEISTVGILGGSGADFIYTLPEVDVYLTGDVGYHVALDAIEMKKNIIDIGHYTESLVKDLLLDYISELNVEVIKSRVEKSPFTIL